MRTRLFRYKENRPAQEAFMPSPLGATNTTATRRALMAAMLWLGACEAGVDEGGPTDILLFNGEGTSRGSVDAIARLLKRHSLRFATANSSELNGMSAERLSAYRLLIVPGGNFETMGNALSPETSAKIRGAVRSGLNYLGVCAGAFFAGASPYNGVNLTGVHFAFQALSAKGVRKAAVTITTPDGERRDHYWEDGPQLSGWGEPVASYPDGTPAVVQGQVGRGWVILTGIHAEADDSWRHGMVFTTLAQADNDYAATLILAAFNSHRLEHF